MQYVAFDAHKHYTLASVARPDGRWSERNGSSTSAGRFEAFSRGVSEAPQ